MFCFIIEMCHVLFYYRNVSYLISAVLPPPPSYNDVMKGPPPERQNISK